jgi:hypothetical protein
MGGLVNFDLGTILSGAGQLAKDIRVAFTGQEPIDAAKAAEIAQKAQELELEQEKAQNTLLLAQADINKIEAASSDKFVSRWRPALGWVGVISLALIYWPRAIVGLVLWARSILLGDPLTPPPDLGLGDLIGLLVPMMGIGGMRTFEKTRGVVDRH